jgi:CheY-like chemotaxis protein
MPLHDLDGAYAIHATLGAIFERERGGAANPKILELVSGLCDRAVDAVNDVDCRVAIRGVKSFASLLYSDDGWKDVDLGPFRGVDAVRVQIINALTVFRGRLDALQRRRPSRPELPALAPKHALRVLIVEDNADAAASLYRLLEICGYSVTLATTANDAFEAAKRVKPDVMLCDIGLPDYDGYALAEALKEDPDTASIRLIAVTAYGKRGDFARSKEAGFKRHLVKPVDPNTLLRELAEEQTPKETDGA